MNKKLKYFVTSLIISSIFVLIIFFILPLLFASFFKDSFFPFPGLMGIAVLARYIIALLIIIPVVYALITALVAEKGTKISSVLVVIAGYILVFVLFSGAAKIYNYSTMAKFRESQELTTSLTESAIDQGDAQYCQEIFDLWKNKKRDEITRSSDYRSDICIFWLAYTANDFSYCDDIKNEDAKNECLIIAAIKTKDTSYCLKSTGYGSPNLKISQCLDAASRAINDISICDEIREKYDSSGSEANRCYARFALFSENPTICNQITRPDLKESCPVLVSQIGNFEQNCDKEYTCYNEGQCELEKKSQKFQCLARVKMFQLDQQGCMDIFKDENYNYCDKINQVIAFKEQNPQLCEPAFLCEGCFNKQTKPVWCDYDYFYYLDRFHEFRVGY